MVILSRRTARSALRVLVTMGLVAVVQACVPASPSSVSAARTPTDVQPPVVLYGDSIGYEITPYLKAKLQIDPKLKLVSRTFGGTNACDWLGTAKSDQIAYKPKYVVIVFIGNYFTQCMNFIGQTPAIGPLVDRTVEGIKNLMREFPTAHFFLLGFARTIADQSIRDAGGITRTEVLNWKLSQLALTTGNTYIASSKVLYDSKGRAQMKLPCTRLLDGGLCGASGIVPVRAPDGNHLCPVTSPAVMGVLPKCQVPSPGALRIANLVNAAIVKRISMK